MLPPQELELNTFTPNRGTENALNHIFNWATSFKNIIYQFILRKVEENVNKFYFSKLVVWINDINNFKQFHTI